MQMMPVLAALDADKDGKLSKEEIANATAALKTVDKNNDGEITEEEMRPDMSAMRRGPGGPGGPGGQGGFGGQRRGRPPMEDDSAGGPGGRGGPGGAGGRPGAGRTTDASAIVDRFMQYDENKDGKLQKSELSERMQTIIDRADKDNDGVATREELEAMMASRSSAGRGGPGGAGRGGPGGAGRGGPGGAGRGGPGGAPGGQRPQRPEADE